MGGFGAGGMGGYPPVGMHGQWGGGHGGGHREEGNSSSGLSEIDKLVNSNKNQRDAARIEVWCVPRQRNLMHLFTLHSPLVACLISVPSVAAHSYRTRSSSTRAGFQGTLSLPWALPTRCGGLPRGDTQSQCASLGGATTIVPCKRELPLTNDACARRVNQVTQVMSKMKLGKPLEDMIVGSQWSVSDPGTESSQVRNPLGHPVTSPPSFLSAVIQTHCSRAWGDSVAIAWQYVCWWCASMTTVTG
jgi:hypothetical protein